MSYRVSSLLNVGPVGGRYVFLLVEWNDFAHGVKEELHRQADAFGQAMHAHGVFVRAFERSTDAVIKQVMDKQWPGQITERFMMDQEPIILIFDQDWEDFDPGQHPYGIIWVSDFQDDPTAVRPLLTELAMRTARGDDVIAYLHEVAEKEQRKNVLDGVERGAGLLARFASYVEIKPEIFGVAVDLKAILRDMAERKT
ncbi:hypothetical protein V1639_11650 [Pseudarthrobacter sp. J75]|uniref:hypothetical protein n=1 Tax=unclassified Pseudarthrobacter TaxID=2647000 RepID=UPI0027889ABC|nr:MULTISPECIES: hypothetical protein [unclassified Pseudarthrobacter]MDP9989198.1 hypothetical protein [Arthrobacter oryzae]MEE2524714.1 hypothetical protein [Pseudarthrobacter sp. J47]MEE2529673.1 hypothetical protein [Pseudarthrobacter sp. J75]